MVSNHSKIKTWWQQPRTKCYHLLISWSCHYQPPLKLSRVSPAKWQSIVQNLRAFAHYDPGAEWRTMSKGKENAPAQLHGTQELSVSGLWLFFRVTMEIPVVHRAQPVLGAPSRPTGVSCRCSCKHTRRGLSFAP